MLILWIPVVIPQFPRSLDANIGFFTDGVLPGSLSPLTCVFFAFSNLLLVKSGSLPQSRYARVKVSKSESVIMGFFNRIESFITRLNLYTKIPLNHETIEIVTGIMTETLSGLVLTNQEIHQGRFSKLILFTIIHVLMCDRGIC